MKPKRSAVERAAVRWCELREEEADYKDWWKAADDVAIAVAEMIRKEKKGGARGRS